NLTGYMDRTLPASSMHDVADHLDGCLACTQLAEEIRSVLVACRTFPTLDPGVELVEKILLRTSGRPRTRSLRERLDRYFLVPVLTPRFAVGAALSLLFIVFSFYWMSPRVAGMASAFAPREVFRSLDRAAQGVYGQGLKIYDKKNEWQAQLSFIKNNVFNRL